jgi:hypothetical protein
MGPVGQTGSAESRRLVLPTMIARWRREADTVLISPGGAVLAASPIPNPEGLQLTGWIILVGPPEWQTLVIDR